VRPAPPERGPAAPAVACRAQSSAVLEGRLVRSRPRALPAPARAGGMTRVVVIGNGMVGQRFLEKLVAHGKDVEVTAFCEEPRPAYDRVQLTSFFSGKSASDLNLADKSLFERAGVT